MIKQMTEIWSDERGAAAVEYALLIGLIALLLFGVVGLLGKSISTPFADAHDGLS